MYYNEKHENIVKSRLDDYVYIGSYSSNEITIDGKKSKSNIIRVKCPYCNNEYDVRISGFKRGDKCSNCCNEYERSFAYHIQVELGEPLNKYWDWEKNTVNPYLIPKRSDRKIWIKCTNKDYHDSYKVSCGHFYEGNRCPYCKLSSGKIHPKDSFAQYHIDNTDPNFLEKYWSDKNTLDPWKLAPRTSKKILIKCQEKDYHGCYHISCDNFTGGKRCSYCGNHKTHSKDSFGFLYPEKVKYWNYDKNKKSPFEVSPYSSKNKYWFICEKCGESFKRTLGSINRNEVGVICKLCSSSKGETAINKYLKNKGYTKDEDYFNDIAYFKDLLSLRMNLLRPDFILPKLGIWIEYDGEQHFNYPNGFHKSIEEFEYLKECDEIKNKYANKHNWKLIRIPYWEFENIEEILNNKLSYDN